MALIPVYRPTVNGMAESTKLLIGADGKTYTRNADQMLGYQYHKMSVQEVIRKGYVLMNIIEQNPQILPNVNTQFAQTVTGEEKQFVDKTASMQNSLQTFKITLKNTSDSEKKLIIGDGSKVITYAKGYPSLGNDVVVGGTFGTQTLAQFQLISSNGGLEVRQLTVEASAESFYTSGSLKILDGGSINPESLQSYEIELLANDISKTNRQDKDFHQIFDHLNGMEVCLPAGQTITIKTKIVAKERTYSMNK